MYLNCHTYYSLRYGVLSPEELVDLAVQSGISALVLTDINNTSCAFQFITACRKNGIKPILGIEFRNEEEFLYLGIARNDEGWRELCALLTEYSLRQEALPKEPPVLPNCYIVFRKLPKAINSLRDNEYIGVRPEEVNQLFSSYLKEHLHKLVVFAPVTFRDEDGFKVHKLLRCIDLNIVLSRLKPENCARQGNTSEGQEKSTNSTNGIPSSCKIPSVSSLPATPPWTAASSTTDSPSPAMSKTIWTCSPNSPFRAANAGMVHATKGYRTHPKN